MSILKKSSIAVALLSIASVSSPVLSQNAFENINGVATITLDDTRGERILNISTTENNGVTALEYSLSENGAIPVPGTIANVNNLIIQTGLASDTINLSGVSLTNVAIDSARGHDTVNITSSIISRSLDVFTQNGHDAITISESIVNGRTRLRTHGGFDEITLAANLFSGAMIVDQGRGPDTLTLMASDFSSSRVNFNGSRGSNDVFDDDGNSNFATPPGIRGYETDDLVSVVYEIGEVGPGGGIVFSTNANGTSGMEAAPEVAGDMLFVFGCNFDTGVTNSINGNSADPGDISSPILVNLGCDAAVAADAYSLNNNGDVVNDWYLPSSEELITLVNVYNSREELTVPTEDFGQISTSYWSSTQASNENAFAVFTFGAFADSPAAAGSQDKDDRRLVWPIRNF